MDNYVIYTFSPLPYFLNSRDRLASQCSHEHTRALPSLDLGDSTLTVCAQSQRPSPSKSGSMHVVWQKRRRSRNGWYLLRQVLPPDQPILLSRSPQPIRSAAWVTSCYQSMLLCMYVASRVTKSCLYRPFTDGSLGATIIFLRLC